MSERADAVSSAVTLARRLRDHKVPASPDRVHAWVEAMALLDPASPMDVYRTGRLTMCGCPEDVATFDVLFASSPFSVPDTADPATTGDEPARPPEDDPRSISPMGEPAAQTDEGDLDEIEIPMASRIERLARRDLAELAALEPELFRQLSRLFTRGSERRRTARSGPAPRGRPDRARTLRRIVTSGGEIADISHTRRRRRPRRLVLLVDMSGSMAAYGEALLRFAHAAGRRSPPRTEVFTIGTRLTRVTPMLETGDPEMAVRDAMAAAVDRGGGTRLGELLKEFLATWGQRGLARGSVVAILSDGWERGDPGLLGEQMARLQRLSHRVVWANPHKAQPGFEPLAGGMAAALPHIDDFVEGHSLDALARLATTLVGSASWSGLRATGGDHAGAR